MAIINLRLKTEYLKYCLVHTEQKDETRYYFHGVAIEVREDGYLYYIGTNGYTALFCRDKTQTGPADMTTIIIPNHIIKDIKKNKYNQEYFDFEFDSETRKVKANEYVYPEFELIDGSFPDTKRIIPDIVSDKVVSPMRADALSLHMKSSKEILKSKDEIRIYAANNCNDNLSIAVVYYTEDIIGLCIGLFHAENTDFDTMNKTLTTFK